MKLNAPDGAVVGRFPVQHDGHVFAVCRYVERNALRAGLVDRAEEWRPRLSLSVAADAVAETISAIAMAVRSPAG